jgi:hypothetical protein
MIKPLPAAEVLDGYFLEARARIIELAAMLDRIDRGGGATADPRMQKLTQALARLQQAGPGRAETIQNIFSIAYDPNWRITQHDAVR